MKYRNARNGSRRQRMRRIARARTELVDTAPIMTRLSSALLTRPLLPSGFEQLQPPSGSWMRAAGFVVQPKSEARTIGRSKAAIFDRHLMRQVHELPHPTIRKVGEVFERCVVRRRDREMDVRHRSHRTADVVRRHQQVVRLGPAGDALDAEKSAEVREV